MTLSPPSLSRIASGPGRLRPDVGRALARHWAALLALALFLLAGLAVLDDYGFTIDEARQRDIGVANLRYAAGDEDAFSGLSAGDNLYGAVWEAALLLAEPALGIESERERHLARHLLTHLPYLIGGLFAYLLALRLFGGRLIALLAMLLFLLHPRLYAHSFYNSKDIPFLVAFVIALFLAHRAFRRNDLPAFALAGAAVGMLVNLRIMGVVLLAAVPIMRGADLLLEAGWAERKRTIITTGAFALAGALAVYASLPHLWDDPIGRAADWWRASADHPTIQRELFQGATLQSTEFPPHYLPVWFSITTPPFALLLGLIGAAGLLLATGRTPLAALRNSRLRFSLLPLGCFAAPVLAAVALDFNLYNGWRQMYFLWAPFALIAAFGLSRLASALAPAGLRAPAYGAAAAGLTATAIAMALIHPNEQVYFNAVVDRAGGRLGTQFVMDYWGHPTRQALEWLLNERSPEAAAVNAPDPTADLLLRENIALLPRSDRERASRRPGPDAAVIRQGEGARPDLALRRFAVYGGAMLTLERKDAPHAALDAARSAELIRDSVFDVHRTDGALILVKEPCAASFLTNAVFRAVVVPVNPDDLPDWRRTRGNEVLRFKFEGYGALFDGKCAARVPLPEYPIAELDVQWEPRFLGEDEAREAMRRAMDEGRPVARAEYDVYLVDRELVYVGGSRDPAGTEARFFLHIEPERTADLPPGRRALGFDNLDFALHENGALLPEALVAIVPLPDYAVASMRTGQFASGEGEIWSANAPLGLTARRRRRSGAHPLAHPRRATMIL